jgi:hypothetical protein
VTALLAAWHAWCRYWDWAGSNIGAMPGCGAVAAVAGACFRKPLRAWWRRHSGADAAEAAHRIAADLWRHHTGTDHPDAPGKDGGNP